MRDGTALKAGDELRVLYGRDVGTRAFVDGVTHAYVKLCFRHQVNGDMLRKDSPLWQLLELVE